MNVHAIPLPTMPDLSLEIVVDTDRFKVELLHDEHEAVLASTHWHQLTLDTRVIRGLVVDAIGEGGDLMADIEAALMRDRRADVREAMKAIRRWA